MGQQLNSAKRISPPQFTESEREQILTDLMSLKKSQIGDFLLRHQLTKSGTKDEIRSRIEAALNGQQISYVDIVQFLDEVTPWGKQHVFLYAGPRISIDGWRDSSWLAQHLKQHRVGRYLNANVPLALPENMKLSSILHDGERLRVTAVKKRIWYERDEDYDEATVANDGNEVELRAFVRRVTRSLVTLDWDLIANHAFLQISQLPSGGKYDEVAQEFFELVGAWLDKQMFSLIDLRPAIARLHELEEDGAHETRSHGINYRTPEGRRIEGRSASCSDPLLGEVNIDAALKVVRTSGVGHVGNFYWLPNLDGHTESNPLEIEVHVNIVGVHRRINFPTPNSERAVRYVLSRIRCHCA